MPSGPLARFIDHTLLRPDATAADVDRLCDEAREHGFASVCVNGAWAARCAQRLRGAPVAVCAVAGFPLGAMSSAAKAGEARLALDDGAREIDVVMHLGALRAGDDELVVRDLAAVAAVCKEHGALLKAILETALFDDDVKARAAALAVRAGADFVKTSTGFGPGGATVADVALLRRTVGPRIGVKASGGIRDAATARAMLAAGATRLGTSASLAIVAQRS